MTTAIVTKLTAKGPGKTFSGPVVSDGLGRIQIVVTDKNGSRSIKGFSKDKCVVRYAQEAI